MFAFASVIASNEKFRRCALPGLQRATEPDSVVAEFTDARSMCSAYNEILDAFAERDDLEALVLLHEDTEILDAEFCAKVRARLKDEDIAVLGVVGARGVRSLKWWEGTGRGRVFETRGELDFGGRDEDVDSVDGLMLVLSPWAVRNLRFDEASYDAFHGYDVDICFAARAAGKRVVVEDIRLFHHTKRGYGDEDAFARASDAFHAKWFPTRPAPNDLPLVSVLIPTYNRVRWAGEALRSALAQTYTRLEIIVGDNASTDGTPDALEAIAAGDERVTIVRRPENLDFYGNSIALLEQATGEYVKFLLDDDLLEPDAVECLLAPMLGNDEVTLSISRRKLIDGDGNRLPDAPHLQPLAQQECLIDGTYLGGLILTRATNWIGEMSTTLFRRDAIEPADLWTLDGREAKANGDLTVWLRLLARGQCAYSPRELSSFRMHETQGGRQGWIQVMGLTDWPFLIDTGRQLGFIPDAAAERAAWSALLGHASRVLRLAESDEDHRLFVEMMQLIVGRLAELRDGVSDEETGDRLDRRVLPASQPVLVP
jgi:GT2 family glycosyltransferase